MKNFRKAFAWMQRVQEACLFTPGISVDVECQFTPANHEEGSIDGFTCKVSVIDQESHERCSADYMPWYGWGLFSKEKAEVEVFLAAHEIRVSKGVSSLTEIEIDDLRSAVVCHVDALADARDTTEGLNMPAAADLYDKEIEKYNRILAKLA